MKRVAVYVALMEEENKLQNLFLACNTLLFMNALVLLALKVLRIQSISFFVLLILAILFFMLQSCFVVNICRQCADTTFKKLYLKYLEVETYFCTEKECENFGKIRKNILIGFVHNNYGTIRRGFAYLQEWQESNLMLYEI